MRSIVDQQSPFFSASFTNSFDQIFSLLVSGGFRLNLPSGSLENRFKRFAQMILSSLDHSLLKFSHPSRCSGYIIPFSPAESTSSNVIFFLSLAKAIPSIVSISLIFYYVALGYLWGPKTRSITSHAMPALRLFLLLRSQYTLHIFDRWRLFRRN